MNRLKDIVELNNFGGRGMATEREQIAKEQKLKREYVAKLNHSLGKYDFRVINYSACGFKGSKADNEKAVRTIKFIADGLQEYIKKNFD